MSEEEIVYPTLPRKIHILGHEITVDPVTRVLATDCIGEVHYDLCLIQISDAMTPTLAHSTLLHEVIHFIEKELSLTMAEDQISPLSAVLYQVLVTQPEILGLRK
jgi:hypothetical protein